MPSINENDSLRTDDKAMAILKSFRGGKAIVNDEEYFILKPYAGIGFVHLGFSFKKKEPQASLTKKGINLLGFSTEDKKPRVFSINILLEVQN